VAVLRQGEAGEKVADICRKVGISSRDHFTACVRNSVKNANQA